MVKHLYVAPFGEIKVTLRKNQKNIICRTDGKTIHLSAPKYVTTKELKSFVLQNIDSIQKLVSRHKEHLEKVEGFQKKQEDKCEIDGEWKNIEITSTTVYEPLYVKDAVIYVHELVARKFDDSITLKKFIYLKLANEFLPERFIKIADKYNFSFNKVSIRDQKKRWGSCSSNKNIALNWRLIKCPRWVQDYIFIHELCHLKEMNHSKRYWTLVENVYPNYKEAEKWLRNYERTLFSDL